jgi:hypothetical protein
MLGIFSLIITHINIPTMKKTTFLSFLVLTLFGCQLDDTMNNYTVSGYFGTPEDGSFGMAFPVSIASNDLIIATSEGDSFQFENLEEGKPYTIRPQANTLDGRSGLSTLDLVSIDNHIKGLNTLTIFQQISADVNMDGLIDENDLAQISACIISNKDCPSWRFVSPDYDGQGNGYIDHYTIDKLFADHDIPFLPIKLGDVNGTIFP